MSVTYIDAIHDAQKDLLTEDRDVFLYGQDIGVFGGAFKATKGLKELFPDRVIDAPISEDAMAGMVTGAAVMGKKPIMEVQFADFSTIAFNQIVNMAATHYYRTGIPANITVRLPCGGTPGTGPFHSQSLEALFAHYPGLHVMTPATVADAYWMLRQAGPRHFSGAQVPVPLAEGGGQLPGNPGHPVRHGPDRPHGEACHRGGVQRHGAGSRACGRPA